MGVDKAGLEVGGRTLLESAIGILRPLCDEVLLATGPAPRHVELGLPVVLDRVADGGPLAGLEAALEAARHERALVIAVDMPHLSGDLLARIAERAERDDCDALLARGPDGVEPLCAAYHVRVAPAARAALDAGDRRMVALFAHSAGAFRPRLETFDVDAGGELANVNTSEDLDRARGLVGGGRA